MGSEQSSQRRVYIENPNIPLLQSVANVGLVDGNLAAKHQLRIRTILRDRRNLQLRLNLAGEPDVDVVDRVIAAQMPPLWQLAARHPNGPARPANPHRGRRPRELRDRGMLLLLREQRRQLDARRRGRGRGRRRRAEKSHDSGAGVGRVAPGVGGGESGRRLERRRREREGSLVGSEGDLGRRKEVVRARVLVVLVLELVVKRHRLERVGEGACGGRRVRRRRNRERRRVEVGHRRRARARVRVGVGVGIRVLETARLLRRVGWRQGFKEFVHVEGLWLWLRW